MDLGAPMNLRVFTFGQTDEQIASSRLKPSFRTVDLASIEGIEETVRVTYGYNTRVSDPVGLRSAGTTVLGVDGRLNQLRYGSTTLRDALIVDGLWCAFEDWGMGNAAEYIADFKAGKNASNKMFVCLPVMYVLFRV